jgi:ribose transport system ATP-binding protein
MTDMQPKGEAAHPAEAKPLIEIRGISKTFGGSRALDMFSLSMYSGEIHVLLGANGSGKSTLIKILSGFHAPDAGGDISIDAERLRFGSPTHSYTLGCRFVHQDLGLVTSMSVSDNLSLGRFATRFGTIRPRAGRTLSKQMLARVGLDVDPDTKISDLGAAQRTGVALARAMRHDDEHPARLLVLDEPTATLPPDEVDQLIAMVKSVAAGGTSVLFVTHHMEEVERIADSVTVLRDGVVIGRSLMRDTSRAELVALIAGGELDELGRSVLPSAGAASTTVNFEVRGLVAGPIRGVTFGVRAGEIVGLAGLTGSGRETALGAAFGGLPREAGDVLVSGVPMPPGRPHVCVAAGMGYLPADRKTTGSIMTLTARENLSLTHLRKFYSGLRLHRRPEVAATRDAFEDFDIRPRSGAELPLSSFSGGNQQKVLFAKWARHQPTVLLLDEPTQGVDVGAKADLHRHIRAMAEAGMSIVVSSSDFDELAVLSDRVLIFRNGLISDELSGSSVNLAAISRAVISETPATGYRSEVAS